jgi:hypothetical protein
MRAHAWAYAFDDVQLLLGKTFTKDDKKFIF